MKNSILLLLVLELFGCLTLASTFTPHSKSYFAQLSLRVKERRDKKGDPCKKIDQRTNTPFISKSNHMTLSSKVRSTDSKQLEDKSGLRIIISGAPASGKGTQCEMIKEKYDVVHLSTGDMLRAAVAARTDVGIQAKDYMDSGNLVPDDVIIGIVSFSKREICCTYLKIESKPYLYSSIGTSDFFRLGTVLMKTIVSKRGGFLTDFRVQQLRPMLLLKLVYVSIVSFS